MDESAVSAQPTPEDAPAQSNPAAHQLRPPQDWLILGFLVLILALASLVALLILIAYQNGPAS